MRWTEAGISGVLLPTAGGRSGAPLEDGAAVAPFAPCHRVVAANGALTGFSAPGGLATKRRMLELTGALGYGQQALFGVEIAS